MLGYTDYFEVGTRVLSAEEKADPMKNYNTCDRDIVYKGHRVDMVIAYYVVRGSDKGKSYQRRSCCKNLLV